MGSWPLVCMIALGAGCGRVAFEPLVDAGPPPACASDPSYLPAAGQRNRYRELVDRTWQEGVDGCRADEAHLAIPGSASEVSASQLTIGAWVGVTDAASEGNWRTVTGQTARYLPWGIAQPSGDTLENCVELFDSTFNDLDCTVRRSALCECEL
jgi:hypothetical protein